MTSGCSVRVRVYLPGVSHETTITVIKRAHGARDIPFLRVLRQRDQVQPKIGPARPGRRECSGADPDAINYSIRIPSSRPSKQKTSNLMQDHDLS